MRRNSPLIQLLFSRKESNNWQNTSVSTVFSGKFESNKPKTTVKNFLCNYKTLNDAFQILNRKNDKNLKLYIIA